jgi:hypothetical protein
VAISVMAWVWDHSRSRHAARLVLLAIADNANSDGGQAWPSTAELMRKAGLGERTVQAAITELVKLGELEVGYNTGPKGCNRYRVIMRTPAESAPPQNLHPAESAPPQNPAPTPAESAPGTVHEPSKNSSAKSSTRPRHDRNAGRHDAQRLCEHLADRVEANGSLRPSITKAWLDAARLLLDLDGRAEAQVHKAIDWCQSNEFWRKNVMSMPTLRTKYDRLRMDADDERRKAANGSRRHPTEDLFERAAQRFAAREAAS